MGCEATVKDERDKRAWPPLRVFVARAVAPSLKVTLPVGVPLPGELALTVAVKVTDWPYTEVLVEEPRVVVVGSLFTCCVRAGELVLLLKLASPPYTAVMEWEPTEREAVARVAWPELRVAVPRVVAPSLSVTEPVGVPVAGATADTVTVKNTVWPDTDGLSEELTVLVVLPGVTVMVPESVAVRLPEGAWMAALPVARPVKVALLLSPAATRSPLTTPPVMPVKDQESAATFARK